MVVLFDYKNVPNATWHMLLVTFEVCLGLLLVVNSMVLINASVYGTKSSQTVLLAVHGLYCNQTVTN